MFKGLAKIQKAGT